MRNLINEDFTNLVPNTFMTENVSLFLYSLIKCVRPYKILEVGFGYSTLFIAKAIDDIRKEDITKESFFTPEKITEGHWVHSGPTYIPDFTCVDSRQIMGCNPNVKVFEDEELIQYVNIVETDFRYFLDNTDGNYDLIWLDFGPPTTHEYKQYYKSVMKRLNPGGSIVIHSTVSNYVARLFLTELKLELKGNSDIELMTFVEPHKKQQSSFTIIKKNVD